MQTNQRAAAKASSLQQCWRGIQDKHCRGIQDTLNIKGKFCPGFHEKQQKSLPLHCNVITQAVSRDRGAQEKMGAILRIKIIVI